jgi:diaminohydroxyphosphoribosylaminopyrimidine deaminase/5-amino-6-(5-phosphoribosylamino)uracil reductase
MEKAGIKVTTGVLQDQARRLNEVYVRYITSHTPFVVLKAASSLDGRIATASGESRWITGEKSRTLVHRLRASVDAVMAGAGTIRSDDPLLTARGTPRKMRTPLRIVIDGRLGIPPAARVFDVRNAPTMVVTTPAAPAEKIRDLERMGVEVLVQKSGSGRVDLKELMRDLGHRGITSVLIEGGGELNASALQEGIVDKVIFFLAPKIIGGRDAVPSVGGQSPARLDLSIPLHDLRVRKAGDDLMVEGYVHRTG